LKLMLDTSVLLEICVPGQHREAKEWFQRILLAAPPPELLVSVLADFELRRALHRKGATKSLEHLEDVAKALRFVPVYAEATRRAARMSATAQPRISDAGAIVAVQALAEGAVLVTTDADLLAVEGLEARRWNEIDPDRLADVEPGVPPESPGSSPV
jgi:predicted nucleic acid-binding protein